MNTNEIARRTIADFGMQWQAYPDNTGYYASTDLFEDIIAPLLRTDDIKGMRVAEIGCGTGRFVNILHQLGAEHVIGVEPSAAFAALQRNTSAYRSRTTLINATGDQIPAGTGLDYVFSIGVLHHIPDPDPVVTAALHALRPGGKLFVWLYGVEGHEVYLRALNWLRQITMRLPHRILELFVRVIHVLVRAYAFVCRFVPLPMHRYMKEVFAPLAVKDQRLVIYDHLNPAYARYYRRDEALDLLRRGGFKDLHAHHRHGYSWAVIGTK